MTNGKIMLKPIDFQSFVRKFIPTIYICMCIYIYIYNFSLEVIVFLDTQKTYRYIYSEEK